LAPPQARVARISGAQNNKIVVTPQKQYSTLSAANDGIVANAKPPIAVATNAKDTSSLPQLNFRVESF